MSKQLALCRNDWQNCVDAWLQSQCVCIVGLMHGYNHNVYVLLVWCMITITMLCISGLMN